jgi:hypothetical protein
MLMEGLVLDPGLRRPQDPSSQSLGRKWCFGTMFNLACSNPMFNAPE